MAYNNHKPVGFWKFILVSTPILTVGNYWLFKGSSSLSGSTFGWSVVLYFVYRFVRVQEWWPWSSPQLANEDGTPVLASNTKDLRTLAQQTVQAAALTRDKKIKKAIVKTAFDSRAASPARAYTFQPTPKMMKKAESFRRVPIASGSSPSSVGVRSKTVRSKTVDRERTVRRKRRPPSPNF